MKKFLLSLAVLATAAISANASEYYQVEAADKVSDPWDSQMFVVLTDASFSAGDSYEFSMDVKATKEAASGGQFHGEPGAYMHWNCVGNVSFGTEWSTFSFKGTVDAEANGAKSIAFNLNDFAEANTYYVANICIKINGEVVATKLVNKYNLGEIVDTPAKDDENGPAAGGEEVDPAPSEGPASCYKIETADKVSDPWDSQMFIVLNDVTFAGGDSYEFSMDVKADKEATSGGQFHGEPGAYMHWNCVGNVSFGTEWNTFSFKGTVDAEADGAKSIAFNLNDFAEANVYYIANVCIKINGEEVATKVMSKYNLGEIVDTPVTEGGNGINNLEAEGAAVAYDLFGRAGATKGFMIKGGMKVLVK